MSRSDNKNDASLANTAANKRHTIERTKMFACSNVIKVIFISKHIIIPEELDIISRIEGKTAKGTPKLWTQE